MYIASAGAKGHGVFANTLIKKDEILSVYTGQRVFKTKNRDSTYQWSYGSKVLQLESGDKVSFDTDGRLEGNMMRFVNDDPLNDGNQNCYKMNVRSTGF